MPLSRITLVLGGARSGKSRYAEGLADDHPAPTYIATAEPFDDEMRDRVRLHQAQRGPRWRTLEAPLDLAGTLRSAATSDALILVDCLTVWLGNLMHYERDIEAETQALLIAIKDLPGRTVFVSNEVGLGIVPENAIARAFRDHAGRLNQAVAAAADRVVFVAAGLPLVMKGQC